MEMEILEWGARRDRGKQEEWDVRTGRLVVPGFPAFWLSLAPPNALSSFTKESMIRYSRFNPH